MKSREIREMSKEEQENKLVEMRTELLGELGNVAMGGSTTNTMKIRMIKRDIARLLTIINEKGEVTNE